MTSVNAVRSTFLSYFGANHHEVVASSSLIPRNDPTLMFTSAGMVQFKQLFTGLEKRSYSRAATSQKCLRAGGKHNDLDNVGYTARHHTFFEMLGNFSFGDYFKDDAIDLAWNLITKEFGLQRERLLVTVYHTDDEARAIWKKVAGFSDDRIISIASSDNFWSAGDTGPCGPCSEIFYDHGPAVPGGPPGSPDADGDRFIEIWNLVFMQFDQLPGGMRVPLPRPSIDTGMGLERISAVLQGTHDNYATDLMRTLIAAVEDATGVAAGGARSVSHRVIADHLRASGFLIADGVTPSNEGRGYVLRRIMRRGMRHAELLGAREPLMHRLVGALVQEMGQAYPELIRAERMIGETLLLEETRFRRTLQRGLALLEDATRTLSSGAVLPGEVAFRLYDTYGFPLDLTEDALRGRGVSVDTAGFAAAMQRQRDEARKAWAGSGEAATEAVWFGIRESVGATEFLGHAMEAAEGVVTAIVRDGHRVEAAEAGETVDVVTNQTPFYAESGGQVGDTGTMSGDEVQLTVIDTQKRLGDVFVHRVHVESGRLKVGSAVSLTVDSARRRAIRAHHSGTHLLHEALRQVLGDHVAQKGSLVSPDRIRFDISHPKPITDAEAAAAEAIANAVIMENTPVTTRLMALDDAVASGARALFGEKYGDEVRVVSMGDARPGQAASAFSVELCGGTHASRTGDLGQLIVIGEGAVSSGVRRIEAVAGEAALAWRREQARLLDAAAAIMRTTPGELPQRIEQLLDERRRLEKGLSDARRQLAMGGGTAAPAAARSVGGVSFLGRVVEGIEMRDLKGLADEGKRTLGSGIVAIAGVDAEGKAGVVVGVTPDLVERFNAVDLVRKAAPAVGGKGGGGRPDMAQAGGPHGQGAHSALAAIEAALEAG